MPGTRRGAITISERDKRALAILAVAAFIALVIYFWPQGETQTAPGALPAVPIAEKRLTRARQLAAAVPGREEAYKKAAATLREREQGLLQADTTAQAQAQLLQILRNVARKQAPPIDIRNTDIGAVRPYGKDYGEALISAQFECRIDQLVNLLADLTAQPELVATNEMRVWTANEKQKTVNVRLTLSGLVPKRLAPEKKGMASF